MLRPILNVSELHGSSTTSPAAVKLIKWIYLHMPKHDIWQRIINGLIFWQRQWVSRLKGKLMAKQKFCKTRGFRRWVKVKHNFQRRQGCFSVMVEASFSLIYVEHLSQCGILRSISCPGTPNRMSLFN
ncbi:hypothetical protein MRB53_020847 [Persea americana]|uniref:Uncharacterized protein n=1 Tax=Persea americana TaxID=3435 RepID=A0ACC2L2B2_PERAE|nr:hypothetical protein MRB53_020847 [Persea americana]